MTLAWVVKISGNFKSLLSVTNPIDVFLQSTYNICETVNVSKDINCLRIKQGRYTRSVTFASFSRFIGFRHGSTSKVTLTLFRDRYMFIYVLHKPPLFTISFVFRYIPPSSTTHRSQLSIKNKIIPL